MPFSEAEQAVGAHKYVLQLVKNLKKPVNLAVGEAERMLGDVRLHVKRDASVCTTIAEDGYDRDLGIRSLKNAVKTDVEKEVIKKYMEKPPVIAEDKPPLEYWLEEKNGLLQVTEQTENSKWNDA